MSRRLLVLLIIIALAVSAFVPLANAQASTPKKTFDISIFNAIRATELGYPRNYQFVFSIYNTNQHLARQFLLRQGQRVDFKLEQGYYAFTLSDRNGITLARMGYRYIPVGAKVRWQSNLGPPDLVPTIKLRIY